MPAMNWNRTKDHCAPPPLEEAETWIKEGSANAKSSGAARAPLLAFVASLAPLHRLHVESNSQFERLAETSAEASSVLVVEATRGRVQALASGAPQDREAIARDEQLKILRGFRSQIVTELRDKFDKACAGAVEGGEAARKAVEAFEREQDVPLALRNTGSVALQTVTLMQVSDLRQQANGALPNDLARMWAALATDEQREVFSYAIRNTLTEILSHGLVGLKQRFPRLPEGAASKEFNATIKLEGSIAQWRAQREPAELKAARASLEMLTRAFKILCGLDVRWLSSSEFSRLYLGGTMTHDPSAQPFKLAKVADVVTRFLPKSPAAWDGLPMGARVR